MTQRPTIASGGERCGLRFSLTPACAVSRLSRASRRDQHHLRPTRSIFWAMRPTTPSASAWPGLLRWRARAALAKGVSLLLLGIWVIASTVWMAARGTLPTAETMGIIGVLALVANLICAVILWRHREGDANRRSVWICSRNDAIGNIAVVAAALGVFGTGTAWPDIAVAAVLAGLGISGGWQIVRQAWGELKGIDHARPIPRQTGTAPRH